MVSQRLGYEIYAPSFLLHPVAPIGLFQKEEVVLVKEPDVLDGLLPDQHGRADYGFDLNRFSIGLLFTGVFPWRDNSEQPLAECLAPKGREIIKGVLPGAVRVQELSGNHGAPGMRFKKPDGLFQVIIRQPGIAVQDEVIIAVIGSFQSLINGSGKSLILFIADDNYLRVLLPDCLKATVRGAVINHDYAAVDIFTLLRCRGDAL